MNKTKWKIESDIGDELRTYAEWFMDLGVDYLLTVSFNEETYQRRRLKNPERMLKFVDQGMRMAGYKGPRVIVAHDNGGTAYYHAHILMRQDGTENKVRSWFFRMGDIDRKDNGPIRTAGAFVYVAHNAFNDGHFDSDRCYWQEDHRRQDR